MVLKVNEIFLDCSKLLQILPLFQSHIGGSSINRHERSEWKFPFSRFFCALFVLFDGFYISLDASMTNNRRENDEKDWQFVASELYIFFHILLFRLLSMLSNHMCNFKNKLKTAFNSLSLFFVGTYKIINFQEK